MEHMDSILDSFYRNLIQGNSYLTVLKGLRTTLLISVLSLFLGTLLGALVCYLRVKPNRFARGAAGLYIAILRGSPVLLVLMLLYYVVFASSSIDAVYVAVAAFSLNVSAHVAELLRSALGTVDRGQVEAARTLGFSRWGAFVHVTMPQLLEVARPVYQSTAVNLIQWTSVVGYVTIVDLTRVINNIGMRTMDPLFMIFVGVALYLLLAYLVYGSFALWEKWQALSLHRRRNEEI
jgi:His/Glu/Gln/Arg/opine family amino acid ABC transporter permease subunit